MKNASKLRKRPLLRKNRRNTNLNVSMMQG